MNEWRRRLTSGLRHHCGGLEKTERDARRDCTAFRQQRTRTLHCVIGVAAM